MADESVAGDVGGGARAGVDHRLRRGAIQRGHPADRFAEIARSWGCDVDVFDVEWGTVHDPEGIAERVRAATGAPFRLGRERFQRGMFEDGADGDLHGKTVAHGGAQPRGHQTEQELYAQAQKIPLGRIGQAEDLVGPTIFLASDAARFITGQTLLVNGGSIMW